MGHGAAAGAYGCRTYGCDDLLLRLRQAITVGRRPWCFLALFAGAAALRSSSTRLRSCPPYRKGAIPSTSLVAHPRTPPPYTTRRSASPPDVLRPELSPPIAAPSSGRGREGSPPSRCWSTAPR